MYAELQSGIVEYLESEEDIFGLPVFADDPTLTEQMVFDATNREGIVMVVGKPRQTSRGASEVVVQVPIMVLGNPKINRTGEDGLRREPEQVVVDLISSLDRYQPEQFWTPIHARPFDSKDPEFGQVGLGMMVETKTLIVRDFAILVTHTGASIADHNYKTFLTTNRGKYYGS
jgi:hypothetical protein